MCENSEGNERSGKVTSCSAPVGNTTCSFSDESGIKKKCLFINFIIYFISISKFIDILKNCRSRQSPKATFNIRLNKVRGLKGLLKASYTAVYSTLFS